MIIHPKTVYGRYGIQYNKYLEGYEKYIGKVVTYLPSSPILPEEVKQEFEGEAGQQYEIIDIDANDDGCWDMDLIFFFKEHTASLSKKKRTIRNQIFNYDRTTSVFQIPFVFMDEIQGELFKAKGKEITSPDIINNLRIVDVKFEKFDNSSHHPHVIYYVEDDLSGVIHRVSYMDYDYKRLADIVLAKENIISLQRVEKPLDTGDRYGSTIIVSQANNTSYVFQDSIIRAEVIPNRSCFNINISNISPSSIKIIWDEASFIDTEGKAVKVSHSGVKYEERNAVQIPSTIIKGAIINEKIFPNTYSGWRSSPLFNDSQIVSNPLKMMLMLPIQIEDVINEYKFCFEIDYKYSLEGIIRKHN